VSFCTKYRRWTGIGLAIANYILKEPGSHNLVVLGGRSKDALEKLKAQSPKHVQILPGDLADFSLGQKAVDLALSSFGQIDALIVNHGVLDPITRIAECNPAEIRKNFDVNFFGAIACVKAAIPELRKTKGRIVLTSSGAASHGYSTWGAYGSSKAALNHLAFTLKTEEPDIITVSIRPGVVDTEMQRELREVHHDKLDKKDQEKFMNAKADNTLLRPEQPGNVLARLALGAPKNLSGQFLSWDDKALQAFQD